MEFYNLTDAQNRLNNCLVLHKGEPVIIQAVENSRTGLIVLAYSVEDGKSISHKLDDTFNLNPVPLGNVNCRGDVYYISRVPARMWKQGLTAENLHARQYGKSSVRFDTSNKSLILAIKGEYPTVDAAIKSAKTQSVTSIAFSRNFSVDEKLNLVYNCKAIAGYYDKGDFQLEKNYFYLKELLQEAVEK